MQEGTFFLWIIAQLWMRLWKSFSYAYNIYTFGSWCQHRTFCCNPFPSLPLSKSHWLRVGEWLLCPPAARAVKKQAGFVAQTPTPTTLEGVITLISCCRSPSFFLPQICQIYCNSPAAGHEHIIIWIRTTNCSFSCESRFNFESLKLFHIVTHLVCHFVFKRGL